MVEGRDGRRQKWGAGRRQGCLAKYLPQRSTEDEGSVSDEDSFRDARRASRSSVLGKEGTDQLRSQ